MSDQLRKQMARVLLDSTLLTFDPIACMGYVYTRKPGECGAVHHTAPVAGSLFEARKDCAEDGSTLGIEFAATDAHSALTRAAHLLANHA
jgi:hypothetical protein